MEKEIFERLKTIYVGLTGNSRVRITPHTRLHGGLKLSSLGSVQLVCAIEDAFGVEITNAELLSFRTVRDIMDCIIKKMNQ